MHQTPCSCSASCPCLPGVGGGVAAQVAPSTPARDSEASFVGLLKGWCSGLNTVPQIHVPWELYNVTVLDSVRSLQL